MYYNYNIICKHNDLYTLRRDTGMEMNEDSLDLLTNV